MVQKADCDANNDNDCIDNVGAEKKDSSAGLKGDVRECPVQALRLDASVLLANAHCVGSSTSTPIVLLWSLDNCGQREGLRGCLILDLFLDFFCSLKKLLE